MSDMRSRHRDERARRMETLKRLAQRDPELDAAPARTSLDDVTLRIPRIRMRRRKRRWLLPLVAGVLIVALAAVALVALGLGSAKNANTLRPLTPVVFTLPNSAKIYCPSMPAWSPNGEYIAVMARVPKSSGQGECDYADMVSNQAMQEQTEHGPSGSFYEDPTTALVLDARTGALVRQLKPLDLAGMLCKGASYCDPTHIKPASLSWTPDGASVLLFSTLDVQLTGLDGQSYGQTRGALEIIRADGTEAPRALVAYGREISTATGPGGGTLPENFYSPPLFTWDLATGAASYTDVHKGGLWNETVDYAPAFQVGPAGKLTPAPAAGSITPWSYGALFLNTYGPSPITQFESSVWAWSADGRHVIPNVDTVAYMKTTNAAPTPLPSYPGIHDPPFVAPPDAATTAVAREITPKSSVIYVARDPRGGRLASFACQPDVIIGMLTIRAAATGKTLLSAQYSFPTVSTSYGCAADAEAINWSPDGSRIAMTDVQDNQIVLWQIPG